MDRSPGIGLLLLMLFVALMILAASWVVHALKIRRNRLARSIALGMLVLAGAYLGLLVGVSATSHEIVLPRGDRKHFCGFYLDCHIGAAVTRVATQPAIGAPPEEITANGIFYVVTVEVSSDARRATLTPAPLALTVIDKNGRRYPRSLQAERLLTGAASAVSPFEQPLGPGEACSRDFVFDLPADVVAPRLLVSVEVMPDRFIEGFIIGNDNSWFHPHTLLRLDG